MQKDALRYWTVAELQRFGSRCEHTSLALALSNLAFNLIRLDKTNQIYLITLDI